MSVVAISDFVLLIMSSQKVTPSIQYPPSYATMFGLLLNCFNLEQGNELQVCVNINYCHIVKKSRNTVHALLGQLENVIEKIRFTGLLLDLKTNGPVYLFMWLCNIRRGI